VIAIHEVAMRESDQSPTALVREDALQSAVHHPRNLGWYAQADLAEQVVEFMIHIAMAHAFVDGNKRTAVRSAEVFLELNGISIPGYADYIHLADLLVSWIAAQHDQRPKIQSALIRHVGSWMA
jgi:death-on-curing protein